MTDRLYRSSREKMLGGVCGGLAEYFQIDVTLIRLITVVISFAGGIGFLAYFIAWIIIPRNPLEQGNYQRHQPHGRDDDNVVETITSNIEEAARTLGEKARDIGEAARNGWENRKGPGWHNGQTAGEGNHQAGEENSQAGEENSQASNQYSDWQERYHYEFRPERRGKRLAGWILIVLGAIFFLDRWFPLWFSMGKMWPLLLIAIGLAVILRGEKR